MKELPMRHFSTSALLLAATTAFALPAAAQAQTYGGLSAGVSLPETSKNSGTFNQTVPATPTFPEIATGTPLGWDTKFDTGYNVSGQIGHRFDGGFRVEGEFFFNRSGIRTHRGVTVGTTDIDAIDASVLTRGAALGTTVGQIVDSGIGSQRNFGAFANAFYDFNSGGSFQPYVGGGVGVVRSKFDYRPSGVDVGQGSDTNFAWQLAAGATYRVNPGFELFGQYNYRDNGKTRLALDLLPADLNAKSRQSIFSVGFRIPFGGAQ
jgi:opacity protein-like surface antigen